MGKCEGKRGHPPLFSRHERASWKSPFALKKKKKKKKQATKDSEIMTKHHYINSMRLCEF